MIQKQDNENKKGRTLKLQTTEVFEKTFDAYKQGYRYIISTGGSRSSKTISILQLIIYLCLTKPNTKVSIVRQSLPALRKSAMYDFFKLLEELDLYDLKYHQKTENHYKFPNGSMVEFFGVADGQRVRGSKRDILYCNEGNELSLDEFNQLMMRTTSCAFIDRNPSEVDHWIDDLLEQDKSFGIHSTFKNNPFLPKAQVEYIESMINIDVNYYRIYALGLSPTDNVRIYSHFKQYTDMVVYDDFCYGLDFGFGRTAMVKCMFKDNEVYIQEMIYESNLTSSDLIEQLKSRIVDRRPIYCDSARPDQIEELKRAGFNARSSDKSVKAGIDTVRSKPIFIHISSENLWKEYRSYMWKTDQSGKIMDEPIKINDHLIDALRYAIQTHKGKTPLSKTTTFFY